MKIGTSGTGDTTWIRSDAIKIDCRIYQNQLAEDIAADQISLKEYMDPFTGGRNTKA